MGYCENCGCKEYSGACVNCHEEIYIEEQYIELNEPIPDLIYNEASKHRKEISDKKKNKSWEEGH